MSIFRLMSAAVDRRHSAIAASADPSPDQLASSDSKDALSALTKYIPTEVIGLYLPSLAVAAALGGSPEPRYKITYLAFGLAVTPLIAFLIYLRARVRTGLHAWPRLKDVPWWPVFASVVAFLAWGLAIPNNPFIAKPILGVVSGFAALFVSTFLSLLEPIFDGS
jgi:hypothetical protein